VLVIGLGTGRCGTKSLTKLLDRGHANVTHECRPVLPWKVDEGMLDLKLDELQSRVSGRVNLVGDVSLYFLPYVRAIQERVSDCRFVCMRREKELVVRSYMRHSRNKNWWQDHDGSVYRIDNEWDKCYPKFNDASSKEEALSLYYDLYYENAELLESEIELFRIFDIDALNSEDGIINIQRFVATGK